MKILLVVLPQAKMASYQIPLGIGYISSSLKRAGHDVYVLNPNHTLEDFDVFIANAITTFQPDLVGTGGLAFHLGQVRAVAAESRRLLPSTHIVIGGALITNQPEVVMAAVPEADFGVIGEGEHTIVELAAALESGTDVDTVKGIVYRATGNIIRTPSRPLEKNLDALPWVDHDGLGLEIYASLHRPGQLAPALIVDFETRVMPIMTSRGCPYSCTFCCHEAGGRRYRTRSLDDVFAEIRYGIERYNINAVNIYDDLFCLNRARIEDFCQRIAPLGLRWLCSLSAGQVDKDILRLMRESGCCCISVGVESMSPTILKSMKKPSSREELEQVLALIYEEKMFVWSNLIFGDPAETIETAMETIDWFCNNNHYDMRWALIGYHPGSQIYDDAVARGLIKDPIAYLADGNCEINGTAMSDEEYRMMRVLVVRYFRSFGFAGRLVGMEFDGSHLVARCVCPYCSVEGSCYTIDSRPGAPYRIICPSCNRSYRVPIFVRKKPSPEVLQLMSSLRDFEVAGAHAEQVKAITDQVISLDPANTEIWRFCILRADAEGDAQRAIELLENAIVRDPYNPALFEEMWFRLAQLGRDKTKYARKAKHLRNMGISHTTFVEID